MNEKLQKEVTFLKVYSVALTLALAGVIFFMIRPGELKSFKEINVERINVLESNGDLKLVISNSKRQHQGVINGKPLPKRERPAGVIFFNSKGDECGGLVYDGNEKNAGLVLSIDKFQDDQVMQLQYIENTEKNKRKYGLQLWNYSKEDGYNERIQAFEELDKIQDKEEIDSFYSKMKEDGLLPEDIMFVGKKSNNEIGVFINDHTGKPRIKLFIDKGPFG